ncbi:regulator of G- signaling 14-like isoform X1, partial [Brachionus plicatilis]
ISIDLILNEISRLYRHQDYVFTSTSNLAVHGGQMPLMTNNNQNLSPVLHFSNHNYEIVAEEHPVIDAEKSPYMMLNKHTNDIYFNKENFLKEDMAHIPKDVSSLSNIEDNNMDSMNSSNGSKSIKNKKSKTQPKEVGSQPQGIKTIKENFANLFLSKKTHTNDSEIYKTIEMEANRFRKNDDGSNFRIKTRTSQAFQFLKSKPPLSVAQKIKPHQNSEDDNLDFYDANHVLGSFEPNQAHNQESNVHNRMSYPVNDRMSKTTATAKRLLFNFISGNSNNSKENQNRPQQFQTRRLSDYHRPTKSLNANDCENSAKEKLNQTKISLTNSLIDVNEEIIKEKSNEIGRVAKWATGFEKLLEDQLGLNIFTDFLKKEYSEENIDFWVRCEKFKKISDLDEMKKEAEDIWQTYLDTSSQCQINVDNKTRSNCKEGMQNPHCKMFELAQSQIFTLMKYDSYSRFLKSQMYKDCIVNEMEGKPILGDKHEDKNTDKKRNSFSQNLANRSPNSNSSSNTNLSNEPVRKEKKKNILPWSKGIDLKI